MKSMKLMMLAALVVVLAACGGPAASAPAPAGAGAAEAAVVDLAGLPRDLDAATTASLDARDDVVLIDVREQDEWDAGHIAGATLIPSSQLQSRWQEIPTDKTVIVYCRSGNRSNVATDFLKQQGLTNVHNMTGGVIAWEAAGLTLEQ
jgi:rhodanese-related sulfurtransferase